MNSFKSLNAATCLILAVAFILLTSGCTNLTPKASEVALATPTAFDDVKQCRILGPVQESTVMGDSYLEVLIRNETAKMGGNVFVRLPSRPTSVENYTNYSDTQTGLVYSCPPIVVNNLQGPPVDWSTTRTR